jgi:hypothetical protein
LGIWLRDLDITRYGDWLAVSVALNFPQQRVHTLAAPVRASTSASMIRSAAKPSISRTRSPSACFSTSSISAILLSVIVIFDLGFGVSQPEPFPKIDGECQRHSRPRCATPVTPRAVSGGDQLQYGRFDPPVDRHSADLAARCHRAPFDASSLNPARIRGFTMIDATVSTPAAHCTGARESACPTLQTGTAGTCGRSID